MRWSTSRKRTPSEPAIEWPGADSCFGGSTGTVVSGATRWLAQHDTRQLTAVAIAPDLGERYLDTIYQTNWLVDVFGEDVMTSDELVTDSPAA